MRTPKRLYAQQRLIYQPELLTCPHCGDLLVMCNYLAWNKTVQTLDGVLRSNAPAGTRSQAANLLGILVVRDSVTTGSSAGMTRATRLFRRAIALEPQNESAQFNLELVLSLGGGKSQAKTAKTAGGGTGAGSDAAGSGY